MPAMSTGEDRIISILVNEYGEEYITPPDLGPGSYLDELEKELTRQREFDLEAEQLEGIMNREGDLTDHEIERRMEEGEFTPEPTEPEFRELKPIKFT